MGYNDGATGSGAVDQQTVTIALNGTTSTAIDLGGHTFMALLMPATVTGTAVSFTASHNGTDYTAVFDDSGNAVSATVAANRFVSMQSAVMAKLAAFRYLKLVSNQTELAERTIQVVLK